MDQDSSPRSGAPGHFATTRWSLVCAAGASPAPVQRRAALEALCGAYWKPLYAFARRRGQRAAAAEDLVQGFFARLLEKNELAVATPERGRFRAFLLAAFVHYQSNERERAAAGKRGGGRAHLSFEVYAAEAELGALEPRADESPERVYERAWALSVLERASARLRAEQERIGRERVYDLLVPALAGEEGTRSYLELGIELGLSENAVKVAVHRLRKRLGELVRDEVLQTLDDPRELEDELARLHLALAGPAPDSP